jgi:LPXTG-site transpeptidase (sortase) family protein
MLRIRKILRRNFVAVFLLTLGVAGLAVSLFLYVHKPTVNKIDTSSPTVDANSIPSSAKPTRQAVANYSVPPANPKYIAIPAIHVANTPVIKLGLQGNGAIATPNNIYLTGWYDASSKPGQKGAMFIYGHVSSWTANGVFYDLKNLHVGDAITITRGDNTTYTYKVLSSKTYPYNKVDMSRVLSPVEPNKPGLNLMTCTGKLIKGTSQFDQRLVVFTTLVGD